MTSQGQGGALQIRGVRTNRQDVRTSNVMAVLAVANIVKSSLGPVGLDKVIFLQIIHNLESIFGDADT
jgi:T-complex protein 1 subunit alpha